MAVFDDHVLQAKRNLSFLQIINGAANSHWDWQVTTCFYTAVHLINAHLAYVSNLHLSGHVETISAINPAKTDSANTVTEKCYLAYRKLYNDSIRSRYLSIHSEDKTSDFNERVAYLTHDKHFKKAVVNLDTVLSYIQETYKTSFPTLEIDCIEIRNKKLTYFAYKQTVAA